MSYFGNGSNLTSSYVTVVVSVIFFILANDR